MAIQFNREQFSVNHYTPEETEERREQDAAHGCVPQVLASEDFIHRTHAEYEELKGSYIEVNRDACTDEEYAAFSAGHDLDRNTYGSKWRIWTGGFPTEAQMAETPWEQRTGDGNLET